jgi:hypothetical protein
LGRQAGSSIHESSAQVMAPSAPPVRRFAPTNSASFFGSSTIWGVFYLTRNSCTAMHRVFSGCGVLIDSTMDTPEFFSKHRAFFAAVPDIFGPATFHGYTCRSVETMYPKSTYMALPSSQMDLQLAGSGPGWLCFVCRCCCFFFFFFFLLPLHFPSTALSLC